MPLEETLATFTYFIQQADKLNLAYFCLFRYGEYSDVKIDGGCSFAPLLSHNFLKHESVQESGVRLYMMC